MPENYDRYRRFKRKETNRLIDSPVIFLKGYTKSELAVGVFSFIGTIYASAISGMVAAIMLILAIGIPVAMKAMRRKLPQNVFAHFMWFIGRWNSGIPKNMKRPKKTFLTM